jgi:hypothetical protein
LADRRVGGVRKGTRRTGGRRDARRVCCSKKKIESFLRSKIRSLKVCFMFDSRWLAAYAVLLVFCWCFVVVTVIGGRSLETLDPSEVYLTEISSKTNKPSLQFKPELINQKR